MWLNGDFLHIKCGISKASCQRLIHHGEVFSIKTENLQAYVDQYYGYDSKIIDWRASNFLSRIDYWVDEFDNRVTHYAIIDIDNLE